MTEAAMQGANCPSGLHLPIHAPQKQPAGATGSSVFPKDTTTLTSGAGDRTADPLIEGRHCSANFCDYLVMFRTQNNLFRFSKTSQLGFG